MRLHKFIRRDGARAVLTSDRTGNNLPPRSTPWIYETSIDFGLNKPSKLKAPLDEIQRAIEEQGYYIWPIADGDDI